MSGPANSAELADRVIGVAHRLRRASMAALAPLGLTPAQERTLRLVSRAAEPARMGEIAYRLGIVPRSATTLVDALEQAGLVRRAIDPDNRRSILVTLTDAGLGVQQEMERQRTAMGEALFASLSERERAQLGRLLEKVLAGGS